MLITKEAIHVNKNPFYPTKNEYLCLQYRHLLICSSSLIPEYINTHNNQKRKIDQIVCNFYQPRVN